MNLISKLLFFFNLGLKNGLRYKRRSLHVIIIVTISAFVLVVVAGFSVSLMEKFMKEMLNNTSHGKIYYKGYYEKKEIAPLELVIKDYGSVIDEILSISNEIKISPVVNTGAVISFKDNSLTMMCYGILPYCNKDNKKIFPTYKIYKDRIVEGEFYNNNTQKGILISSYVATNLNCKLRDKIILFTVDSYGSFNAIELEVIGIYISGYKDKDENICIADIESIQELVGTEDAVTEVSLFFDNYKDAEKFKPIIEKKLKDKNLEYFSWKDLLGSFIYAMDIGVKFQYVIYLIFIIVASFGIMNTVLITIFDRLRDIGTLRAIGYTKNDISLIVITEVLILGFVGAVIGTILGSGLVYYFSIYGISISDSAKDIASAWISTNKIYPVFNIKQFIIPFIISAIVPVIATFYPLLVLRKMQVKEILGYL